MLKYILTLFTSGAAKAGATTLGAGGMLALVLNLHAGVTERIDSNQDKLRTVELQLAPVPTELRNQTKSIDRIEGYVRDLHNHILKSNND